MVKPMPGYNANVNRSPDSPRQLPALLQWTPSGRALVFVLAASSIWCLLSEMYGLCDMRTFFYVVLLPATVALYAIAVLDRLRGDRRLWRAVVIGSLAGLVGAIVYDVFRLPFVFSDAWGMGRFGIPQMPLFKVFPRFGALILGEPLEQSSYSAAAHWLGWAYHFSNGATFGVMFAAMYAGAREAIGAAKRRFDLKPVLWAMLMAVGIEICLLLSPYGTFFNIPINQRFIIVTVAAHVLFGIGLGIYFAWHAARWRLTAAVETVRAG